MRCRSLIKHITPFTTNKQKKKKNKMWDETVAGPKPEHGLGRLRNKINAQPIDIKGIHIYSCMHMYVFGN